MTKDRSRSRPCGWRRGTRDAAVQGGRHRGIGAAGLHGRAGARGFTLLELLVAFALLGLIAVLLLGGVRLGTRAWEAGALRNDQASEVQVVQTFLRRQLGRAYPPDRPREGASSRFAFEGTDEAVSFISPLPAHLAPGGLYQMSVYPSGLPGRRRLMVSWRLVQLGLDDGGGGAEADETVLLEDIREVQFSYLDRSPEGGPGRWWDRWPDETRLPALIHVRVAFGAADGRYWPELVIALEFAAGSDALPGRP